MVLSARIVSQPLAAAVPIVTPVVTTKAGLRGVSGGALIPSAVLNHARAGGVFAWDATPAADNDGTRINPGGGTAAGWRRVFSGALDVGWFDDDIQAALDAAAAGAAREVYLPKGEYAISAGLMIVSTAANPVALRGEGRDSHIIATIAGTNTSAIAASGADFSHATIRDLRISGTFSRALRLVAADGSNVRVERCEISGHTAFASGVTLAAIQIGGLDDVRIVGNTISGGGYDNGDGTGQGYDILKDSGALQSRITIADNYISSDKTVISVALFDVADSSVRGNYVDQGDTPGALSPNVTFGYGITLYDTVGGNVCRRNIVTGNHVRNACGSGIYLEQQFDAVVSANVIQDVCKQIDEPSLPKAGIVANGAAAVITGNVIKTTTGATHGIAITQPGTAVMGNFVEDVSAAVVVGDAHRSSITGNTFVEAVHGVLIDGVDPIGLSITGNSMTNVAAGLSVQPGATMTDSIFGYNTVEGGQIGAYLAAGTNNTIVGNNVSGSSSWGIQVLSDTNLVEGNVVRGSTADGGILYQGDSGRVSGNIATGNTGTQISITGANVLQERNRVTASGVLNGTATLTAGTVTVNSSEIQAGDLVLLTRLTQGAAPGHLTSSTIVAGTSFDIDSSDAGDDADVYWEIQH